MWAKALLWVRSFFLHRLKILKPQEVCFQEAKHPFGRYCSPLGNINSWFCVDTTGPYLSWLYQEQIFPLPGERCLNRVADKQEPVGFRELLLVKAGRPKFDLQNTRDSDRHSGTHL